MEFKDKDAIYLQIADFISDHILAGTWKPDEKIPSVRDMAVQLEVNPNTVMRSYELLQQQEVIYNKRGLGFFVVAEVVTKVKDIKKERFLKHELPEFFKTISLLDISLADIENKYAQFLNPNSKTGIK